MPGDASIFANLVLKEPVYRPQGLRPYEGEQASLKATMKKALDLKLGATEKAYQMAYFNRDTQSAEDLRKTLIAAWRKAGIYLAPCGSLIGRLNADVDEFRAKHIIAPTTTTPLEHILPARSDSNIKAYQATGLAEDERNTPAQAASIQKGIAARNRRPEFYTRMEKAYQEACFDNAPYKDDIGHRLVHAWNNDGISNKVAHSHLLTQLGKEPREAKQTIKKAAKLEARKARFAALDERRAEKIAQAAIDDAAAEAAISARKAGVLATIERARQAKAAADAAKAAAKAAAEAEQAAAEEAARLATATIQKPAILDRPTAKKLPANIAAVTRVDPMASENNSKTYDRVAESRISSRPADKPIPKPAFLEEYLKGLPKPDLYTSRIGIKKTAPVATTYTPDPVAKIALANYCAVDPELGRTIATYKTIYNPMATEAMMRVEKNIGEQLKASNIPPILANHIIAEIKAEAVHLERQSRFSARTR